MKKRTKWIIGIIIIGIIVPLILAANHERIYILWTLNKLSPVEKSILDDCIRCRSLSHDSDEPIVALGRGNVFYLDLESKICSTFVVGCDCLTVPYSIQDLRDEHPIVKYTKKSVDYCIGVINEGYEKNLVEGYEKGVRKKGK